MNGDIYMVIPRIKTEMKPSFGHFWLVLKVSFVSFGSKRKKGQNESRGNKISFSPFFHRIGS